MISVIIPVYNVEKYLRECLDSVLRQTYQDFEVLLIDDGSRDGSGQICDEYARKDGRVSVIHKQNGGVSAARNLGLQQAKGEFIAFIDSDDVVSEFYLEKLYNGIQEGDADVCLCKYSRLTDNSLIPVEEKALKTYINNKGVDTYFEQFLSHYIIVLCKENTSCWHGSTWRMLFRKSSFSYTLQENISICEDLIYVMRNFSSVNRINVVDEAMYLYRVNATSTTAYYRKNFLENQKVYMLEFGDILRGLGLSDEREAEKIIAAKGAFSVAVLCWNEIRFRKQITNFKDNIERYKKDEVYAYLTLKNALRIKNRGKKVKCVALWLLVKSNLYKLL